MNNIKKISRRIAAFVAALTFALGLFTGTGLAEAAEGCPHHTHTEECIDETGVCTFECELCEQESLVLDFEDMPVQPDSDFTAELPEAEAPVQQDTGAASYSELAQRIASAEPVVVLSENFAEQAQDAWTPISVPSGQQIVLDLNGQQLVSSAPRAAITVAGEGTVLTVMDSKGSASITARGGDSIFEVMDGAVLNIVDGTYVLEAQQTRAITAVSGTVSIGAQNVQNLPLITRTQQAVQQPDFGGAILAAGNANITLLGGTISGTSAINGGAIAVLEDAQLNASGGAITASTAREKGGAVYFAGPVSDAWLRGTRFEGNVPSDVESAAAPEETEETAPSTEEEITEEDEADVPDMASPAEEEEAEEPAAEASAEQPEVSAEEEPVSDNAPATNEPATAEELVQAIAQGVSPVKLAANITVAQGAVLAAEGEETANTVELPLQVPQYLVLDLNGYTLSVQGSGERAFLETSGYFELIDSAGDKGHVGIGGTIAASGVDSIVLVSGAGAKAILTVGTLKVGAGAQRGAEVRDGAALTLSGTSIEGAGETAELGGGVLVDGAVMQMTGLAQNGYMYGRIEGTLAENGGGIAVVNGGSLEMSGGRIENSRAVQNGGGIYVDDDSTARVTGSAIVANNKAARIPANIWFENGSYDHVETETGDGAAAAARLQRQITDAAAGEGSDAVVAEGKIALGTALVVPQGSVTLNVEGNIVLDAAAAKESGSAEAIRVKQNASLTLTGYGQIRGENLAAAIVVENGGELILDGPTVRNTNGEHGISVQNGSLTMKSGSVEGSGQTVSRGGGIYLNGGTHTIAGGTISGNRAHNGGGIYAVNGASVMVEDEAVISGNTASRGAGVYTAAGTITAGSGATRAEIAGTITGNTAADFGGGLYTAAGTEALVAGTDCIFGNTPDQVYTEAGANVDYDEAKTAALNKSIEAAVKDGGTVDLSDLPGTIVADDTIRIASNKPVSITLDLEQNRTIRWTGKKAQVLDNILFDVQGPVTLTISGSGRIEGGTAAAALVKLSSNNAGTPKLVLNGSTLTNTDGLHAVWSDSAAIEMSGSAAIVNSGRTTSAASKTAATPDTASGAAIYADGGTVTISGGTIADNGSPWTTNIDNDTIVGGTKRYGAVYVKNGKLNISGGTLTGNQALQGGAVAADKTELTITGGTFGSRSRAYSTGNMASWGGALWTNSSSVSITGGIFAGNNASEGGAIYVDGGSASIAGDTKIEYNAAVMGSKMHANGGASLNNWRGAGGGIYVAGGSVTLGGSAVVANNNARGDKENDTSSWTGCGGGIAVAGSSTRAASLILKEEAKVQYNTASRRGGGVYTVRGGDLRLEGSALVGGNTAQEKDAQKYHPNLYVRDNQLGSWDAFVSADGAADQTGDSTEFLSKAQDGRIALSTLQPAEGGMYTVNGAVTLAGDLTIDLEGRTLGYDGAAAGNSALLVVPEGTTLTIENTVGGANAGILGTDENGLQSLIRLEGTGSKVVLKGGNLTNEIGHAIYAPQGGDVLVDGVDASITNSGSPSAPGGAIMMEGTGTITVEQGIFSGNRALLGGAIYSSAVPAGGSAAPGSEASYSLRIHGGTFTGNTANDGGAVWAQRMWMSDGEISGNRAVWSGGRSGQGGGICITRAEGSRDVDSSIMNMMLTGAKIHANTAEGVGGGIALSWGTHAEIAGKAAKAVQIQGNTAEAKATDTAGSNSIPHAFAGGGIFIEHRTGKWNGTDRFGSLTVRNLLVTDNTAQYGGGIGLCNDGSLKIFDIDGASVHSNHINGTLSDQQLAGTLDAPQAVREASVDILGDTKYDKNTANAQAGSLSASMLGNDKANWTGKKTVTSANSTKSVVDVNGQGAAVTGLYTFGLTNAIAGSLSGDASATCVISGNVSRTGGGGIGGNGGFDAGFSSSDSKDEHPVPVSPAASVSADLAVRKTVDKPEDVTNVPMTFTFRLAQVEGPQTEDGMMMAQIPYSELKIDVAAGKGLSAESSFRGIRFPADGTYKFQITEDIASVDDFWSLAGAQAWTATVVVSGTEENDQKFAVSYEAEGAAGGAEAAEFVNVYTSPDVFRPRVEKTVVDETGSMQKRAFQFALQAQAGTPMPADVVQNGDAMTATVIVETDESGAGEAFFGSIQYNEAGTYMYTIRELEDAEPAQGMIYDKTVWTLMVDVRDVRGSKVISSVTYEKQNTEEPEDDEEQTFALVVTDAASFVNRIEMPEPSATPETSETPAPSETPGPSATPEPSTSPDASETPAPSVTPEPSTTETPNTTPDPSETPAPSVTPGPSATQTPGVSQTPSTTPAPSATQTPSTVPGPNTTPAVTTTPGPDAPTPVTPGVVQTPAATQPAQAAVPSAPTTGTIGSIGTTGNPEVIVNTRPERPDTQPTSDTAVSEPEQPAEEPTSDTMAGEPEWPAGPEEATSTTLTAPSEETAVEPTSDTMAATPEWPEETDSITLATTEPTQEQTMSDTTESAKETTGTISSVGGYTGTPSVVAHSDGTVGNVPKTDDAQFPGLWILLAIAGVAGSAAGLLGWRRTMRSKTGR